MPKDTSLDMDQYLVIRMGLTYLSVIKQTNQEILEPISIMRIIIVCILKVVVSHGKEFQEVKMVTPF